MKKLKYYFCYYSNYIITYSFYVYFFIYILGGLYNKSVVYNYALLLMFGMYLGYRLAVYAYDSLKKMK